MGKFKKVEDKDYKKLYEKLVNEIKTQHDYWHSMDHEYHTIERETRWSEYGRLLAFITGLNNE